MNLEPEFLHDRSHWLRRRHLTVGEIEDEPAGPRTLAVGNAARNDTQAKNCEKQHSVLH